MVVAQLQQHVVAKNSKTSLETSSADGKTLVPVSEMGRITCDMEFRFMLHRHWSLYEVSLLADGVSHSVGGGASRIVRNPCSWFRRCLKQQ